MNNNIPSSPSTSEGSALIVSLALLTMFLFLATAFTRLASVEREAGKDWSHDIQARLLARSGLEKVTSSTGWSVQYGGEDRNGNRNNNSLGGKIGTEEASGNNNGVLEPFCDPKNALRPSMFVDEDGDHQPDLQPIDHDADPSTPPRYRGFSGELPASLPGGRDTYVLKVIDNNTKINVNSCNPNIASIIDRIYQIHTGSSEQPGTKYIIGDKKSPYTKQVRSDPDRDDQDEYVRHHRNTIRPTVKLNMESMEIGGGFPSMEAVKNNVPADVWKKLKPFLTLPSRTWIDKSTVRPKPQTTLTETGKAGSTGTPSPARYDFRYSREPRAPININRAREPVLQAVIEAIEARAFHAGAQKNASYYEMVDLNVDLTPHRAQKIARKILQYRRGNLSIWFGGQKKTGPFETWQEFDEFIDQHIVEDRDYTGPIHPENLGYPDDLGYLLRVHFQPNTRPGKTNPDQNAGYRWRRDQTGNTVTLDKTDFRRYTTEFTFYPGGYFHVVSHGRVTDGRNRPRATARMEATVRLYRLARHTTMRDFAVNSKGTHGGGRGTKRIAYHPELPNNPGWSNIRGPYEGENPQKPQTGADIAGQISVAPKHNQRYNHDIYWGFWDSDDVNSSPNVAPNLTYARHSRAYSGVNDDGTFRNRGLYAGAFNAMEISTPEPRKWLHNDPRNYSDIASDGLLIGADRYRQIRYQTTRTSIPEWKQGHVEFWWKPRTNLLDQPSTTTLFHQYFLGKNTRIQVPTYTNAAASTGSRIIESHHTTRKISFFPGCRTKFPLATINSKSEAETGSNWGNASGYVLSLSFRNKSGNPSYVFHIGFTGHRSPGSIWTTPSRGGADDVLDAGELTASDVVLELSVKDRDALKPEPGTWQHVVLNWQPEDVSLSYPEHNGTFNGPDGNGSWHMNYEEQTRTILGGQFWINGTGGADQTNRKIYANQVETPTSHSGTVRIPDYLPLAHEFTKQDTDGDGKTDYRCHEKDHSFRMDPVLLYRSSNTHGNSGYLANRNEVGNRDARGIFADGTLDEGYITGTPKAARDGTGVDPKRYYSGNINQFGHPSLPRYVGRIRRVSDPYWDDGGTLDRFEHYAVPGQGIFTDKKHGKKQIEVLRLAHTQYLPGRKKGGNSFPDRNTPYFQIRVRPDTAYYNDPFGYTGPGINSNHPSNRWLGAPRTPDELFGRSLSLSSSDRFLQYRIDPASMNHEKSRTSPFLEDITVFYRNRNTNRLISLTIW